MRQSEHFLEKKSTSDMWNYKLHLADLAALVSVPISHQSVMAQRELNWKTKLPVHQSMLQTSPADTIFEDTCSWRTFLRRLLGFQKHECSCHSMYKNCKLASNNPSQICVCVFDVRSASDCEYQLCTTVNMTGLPAVRAAHEHVYV